MTTTASDAFQPTRLHQAAHARQVGPVLPTRPPRRLSLPARISGPLPLILAASMLMALIGALIAGPWLDRSNPSRRAAGPAILAPASPAPDETSTDRTLLEISLAAGALPTGENTSAGLTRFTIPVGASATWTPTCCAGPLVEYVISGRYTVRAQDSITVTRANGSVEEVAAATEVTLGAGDGLLSRNETVAEVSNSGPDPVDLLSWVLIDDTPRFDEHRLPGWVRIGTPDIENPLTLPTSAMVISLRQVTVSNGTSVPAPAGKTSVQFGLPADSANGFISHVSDGSVEVYGDIGEPVTVYILALTQAEGEASTPVS